jgi:site-specific DNA-methyltransferase (adenine-specific)
MNTSNIDSELAKAAAAGGHWVQRLVLPCGVTLYQGDCEWVNASADLVVTDPPYGVTDHDWDVVVHPSKWMGERGAVVTATEPYATKLINDSALKFRYDCVWVKNCVSNAMNAGKMPMRRHERVLVFGDYSWNPQKRRRSAEEMARLNMEQRKRMEYASPDTVLQFASVNCRSGDRTSHPSQKPVSLMEWLVANFTLPGETVIDPFMGSGTTGIACIRTGRNFIGIEKDPEHFETARKRIEAELAQGDLFRQSK